MLAEHINLKIVLILTVGFGFAAILGWLSHRLKLSPILGYLIAGYLIGPFSPGFVADMQVAEQLAEIGVVLMMFSVGLHFKWQDLAKYKNIAITGAVVQTALTTIASIFLLQSFGWSLESGIFLGLAIGVASTVVMVRVLSDNRLLTTKEGFISVGWLVVEDYITVLILLLIPILATFTGVESSCLKEIFILFGWTLLKFIALYVVLFVLGSRVISFLLNRVHGSKSSELFILTVLAITFLLAVGSTYLLGTSIALGAFIAGMVIGRTSTRHQVSINTIPLKDVFVVIFFLSIGMLFNPLVIIENFFLFITVLGIILLAKPLFAFVIMKLFKYPSNIALTVALSLAQIGEFSFILAEEATIHRIFSDTGYDVIVACALVSISINPLLFKLLRRHKASV